MKDKDSIQQVKEKQTAFTSENETGTRTPNRNASRTERIDRRNKRFKFKIQKIINEDKTKASHIYSLPLFLTVSKLPIQKFIN